MQLFQYKQYLNVWISLNIIQLAWDIKWVIAGDEANNNVVLWVKMFADHLKTVYR